MKKAPKTATKKKAKKSAPQKPAKAAKPAVRASKPVKKAPPREQLIVRSAVKPPEPISKEKETPLTEHQISKFRDFLIQKRDDLVIVVQRKKEQEIEEVVTGDEADIATRSVEKEMLFELTDSEQQTLDLVEAALRRIEKGTFGSCEYCRKPIARMRLDVMPWARYCIRCQAQQEIPSGE